MNCPSHYVPTTLRWIQASHSRQTSQQQIITVFTPLMSYPSFGPRFSPVWRTFIHAHTIYIVLYSNVTIYIYFLPISHLMISSYISFHDTSLPRSFPKRSLHGQSSFLSYALCDTLTHLLSMVELVLLVCLFIYSQGSRRKKFLEK